LIAVDFVIIDSPPILAVTDASILASRTDGVLLVLKPEVSNYMLLIKPLFS